MNKIIKNILLLLIVLVLTYFFSGYFYNQIYSLVYGSASSLFIIYAGIAKLLAVFVLSYIFFVLLVFAGFGDKKKYWWIGILVIPVVIFELYFDWAHIYIPIVVGIVGWGVGFLVSKALAFKKS